MRRDEAENEPDTHSCQCQRAEVKDVFNRPLLVFVGGSSLAHSLECYLTLYFDTVKSLHK